MNGWLHWTASHVKTFFFTGLYICLDDVLIKYDIKPEDVFGKFKGILYDACGGHPDPQDVLQGGDVRRGCDSVQVSEVTEMFTTTH